LEGKAGKGGKKMSTEEMRKENGQKNRKGKKEQRVEKEGTMGRQEGKAGRDSKKESTEVKVD
jgi:hypothetical protein